MRILSVGPLWRGSDAGGLFRALSRQGCLIEVVDEFYYISLRSKNVFLKLAERVVRQMQVVEFNNSIISSLKMFKPDVLFIYKGVFILPSTLQFAQSLNCKTTLFYPDVSMSSHGKNIPNSIPYYNFIFTTKTYGIKDLATQFNYYNSGFVPHGYDPEIHRKFHISNNEKKIFGCDVSFIGTWSPKKEALLTALKLNLPEININIWGGQWDKVKSDVLKSSIKYAPVLGDLYSIAIQCSKINLGILSEKVIGASSGDLITARSFHIPGSSGFMLHEKNEESITYFKENEEAVFFTDNEELITKVKYYLENEDLRIKIQNAGHLRAIKEHSLDERAKKVIIKLNELLL